MGLIIGGKWVDKWYDTSSSDGKFIREESGFRDWVKADGSTPFTPEPDRYHLYVSLACPWAHRALIFRKLKDLENIISLSIVDPLMLSHGWEFSSSSGSIPDSVNEKAYLYEIYLDADPNYEGRATVPVLWDKRGHTIVNNESSEIIRMFNSEFNGLTGNRLDFYPLELRQRIDEINDFVYRNINNGVYKAGFATVQQAYEEAFYDLFNALEKIEDILSGQQYLIGDRLTEADVRLFTTLIRFDAVYYSHFKCNKKRIADYPNLFRYLKSLYHHDKIKDTVNFSHIKKHYYISQKMINPNGIVPLGPDINL
ncbi:MAG: glutathione S-transferase family protein [Candidatus Omnitrophota bacterium]